MKRELVVGALALPLAACLALDPPEGVIACSDDADCPSAWTCETSRCFRSPSGVDGGSTRDAAQSRSDGSTTRIEGGLDDGGGSSDSGPPDGGAPDGGPPPLPVCTTCTPGSTDGCSSGRLCFMDWTRGCTFCQARTGVNAGDGGSCRTSADCQSGFECLRGQCREQCDPASPACTNPDQYCFDMAAPDTGGLCLDPCLPGGGNCGSGESCHIVFAWTGARGSTCAPEGDVPRHGQCNYTDQLCQRNDYCARYSSPTSCFPACSSGGIVGCPPGYDFCLTYQTVEPTDERPGACMKTCGTTADCDPGFTCLAYNAAYSLCLPMCEVDADCDVGETCDPVARSCVD